MLETANYRDFLILNGGLRFDQIQYRAKKSGAEISDVSGMWNYNVGAVFKPIPDHQPLWGLRHVIGAGRRRT